MLREWSKEQEMRARSLSPVEEKNARDNACLDRAQSVQRRTRWLYLSAAKQEVLTLSVQLRVS